MLELRDLRVSYGPIEAVAGIDLDVGDREVVALMGPNGAGKTSTLRAISQLAPSEGSATFDGSALRSLSVQGAARRGLIHVPEGRHIWASLTVHENLQVATSARRRRPEGYSIDEVYDLFTPLQALRQRRGWMLSGGEQQMVAIGRALVAGPRMLLLDEPSLGLAPIVTTSLFQALAQVAERTPILLVEQNTALALKLATRAYVMVGGKIAMSGSSAELTDRGAVLASYLGEQTDDGDEATLITERITGR